MRGQSRQTVERLQREGFLSYSMQWFLIPDLQTGCVCHLGSFVKILSYSQATPHEVPIQ